ncbi:hypothetical protein ACHAXA_006379 [Cyclostephanos tholiformis]|uniref:Rad60/SUMO-like domain-containing protein n=1 Tax=Cyclostephanos tholiformis TaxID=382380 RepID=A0ABD3SDH1_9STRA
MSNTFPLLSTGSTDEYETDDYSPSLSSTAEEEEETAATGRRSRATTTSRGCQAFKGKGDGRGSGGASKGVKNTGQQRRASPPSSTCNDGVRGNNDSATGERGKINCEFHLPGTGPDSIDCVGKMNDVKNQKNQNDLSSARNDDDDDDDDDDDSDPFANLSRFQGNKRRKLPSGNSSASNSSDEDDESVREDSDFTSNSSSSSDGYTTKKKNVPRSFSAAKPATKATVKSSSAKSKSANSNDADSHLDSDSSISIVEFMGLAPRRNPSRETRSSLRTQTVARSAGTTLVKKNSMVDKIESTTDSGLIEMLSDDDDIICGTFRQSPKKRFPSPASAVAAAAAHKKKEEQHDPQVRAESQAALVKGRIARERLKAAQQYKAKELGLPPPPSLPPMASFHPNPSQNAALVKKTATVVKQPSAVTTTVYSGPTIQLTLQYSHPKTNKNSKSNIKIKTDQPLQHLLDAFNSQQKQINEGNSILCITNATFDGEKINMTKTPSFYDMEDSDLVDVVVMVVEA